MPGHVYAEYMEEKDVDIGISWQHDIRREKYHDSTMNIVNDIDWAALFP